MANACPKAVSLRRHKKPSKRGDDSNAGVRMNKSIWRVTRALVACLGTFMLVACSGGGGGSGSTMPPSGLTYPSPSPFTIKQAISPLQPTVVGSVTGYSVAPALPAGLGIDSRTGVISGTPTAVAAKMTYTVTAQNAGGSTTAGLSIVVNDVAPHIAYQIPAYSFSANVGAQSVRPMSTGGTVVSWSVAPALPAGLVLNTTDGSISGTPTTATPVATYVVTASNSGGQSTFNLMLAVGPAPILDVGHSSGLTLMRLNGSALLSLDAPPQAAAVPQSLGHWVLQDYASGAILVSGDLPVCSNSFNCTDVCFAAACNSPVYPIYPLVDLAGDTMIDPVPGGQFAYASGPVVSAPSGVEIRSASTGEVLATIPGQFWWYQLAADGSYVITASDTALSLYTTSGRKLFSLPGLYRTAIAFSAPSAIQLAFLTCPGNPAVCPSPGGTNVIERIPVATGSPTASAPFQGAFYAWFHDGARFLTTLGSTVFTYSSGGALEDSRQVQPSHVGTAQGPWWWTLGEGSFSNLNIYKVGGGAPTAFSVFGNIVVSSGSTLGLIESMGAPSNKVGVIDLSGATPTSATYTMPTSFVSAYAAASATMWVSGDDNGVVIDGASLAGPPRFLTLGAVQSVAAGSGYFSVATASGQIFDFNASTHALAGTINFPSVSLAMSSDGSVLAAPDGSLALFQGEGLSQSVNIYSLPGASLINSFAYSPPQAVAISLSGSGTVLLSQSPSNNPPCAATAVAVTGGAPIWCDTTGTVDKAQLSPDGTLVTASTERFSSPNPITRIYKNGVLGTSVPGWSVGWLDNTRFLVDNYQVDVVTNNTVYLGNIVYSSQGSALGTPALPEAIDFRVISADAVYSPAMNTIYSVTTSTPIWMSGNSSTGIGAASSSEVIFTSGTRVLAQPH